MLELLLNAELYDPEPQGRRHLVIAGERVVWAGRSVPALDKSLGVAERDLAGRRVIPGFIDAHVHLTGGGERRAPTRECLPFHSAGSPWAASRPPSACLEPMTSSGPRRSSSPSPEG